MEDTTLHLAWVDVGAGEWSDDEATYYRPLGLSEEPILVFSDIITPLVVSVTVFLMAVVFRNKRAV